MSMNVSGVCFVDVFVIPFCVVCGYSVTTEQQVPSIQHFIHLMKARNMWCCIMRRDEGVEM
jgi:hypothetical protein